MRFSRTNMRLAAARLPDLSREIDAQAAEFSITHFCPRNPGLTKSTTYARETAKIGRSLFKSSLSARGRGSACSSSRKLPPFRCKLPPWRLVRKDLEADLE